MKTKRFEDTKTRKRGESGKTKEKDDKENDKMMKSEECEAR